MLDYIKNLHIHEFGPINEQGFQFCKQCNKALFIGVPECQHKFRIQNTIKNTSTFGPDKIIYIQECMKCGTLKKFEV